MLKCAICDDQIEDIRKIKLLMEEFFKIHNIDDYSIDCFSDGASLIPHILTYQLIILDIELNNMNGITLIRKHLTFTNNRNVILISNSNIYLKDGYSIRPINYLLKPIDKKEFFNTLNTFIKLNHYNNLYITEKNDKFKIKDIVYIEAKDKKTFIHLINREIISYKPVKDWCFELENYSFIKCHQAFLVNLSYVSKIEHHTVILKDNTVIPLSRNNKNEFKEQYIQYLGELI